MQDLNKVGFWVATGSGKTLLMHINILQYQHYLNLHGGKAVNRVILLTLNEGLSHQHLEEFRLSGIDAELFSKEGRGIGFFEAGNFYPDFILWLLAGDRQYVSFIDPKGLLNLEGPKDPKIWFHLTIKDLERQLGDPAVILNSFIVSSTRVPEVAWWDPGMTKEEFEARNVLFQREDRATYIEKLLGKVGT